MTAAMGDLAIGSEEYRAVAVRNSLALHAACNGTDQSAQADAYEKLWQYLFRVAFQFVSDQPDAEALAQDCTQAALIRIHSRLADCREPGAFLGWARRIVERLALDELRRLKRLMRPEENETDGDADEAFSGQQLGVSRPPPEDAGLDELVNLINHAPVSARSRRVVVGRFWDGFADEELARFESSLTGRPVLPSQVQVTRSKDIHKLKGYSPLLDYLRPDH